MKYLKSFINIYIYIYAALVSTLIPFVIFTYVTANGIIGQKTEAIEGFMLYALFPFPIASFILTVFTLVIFRLLFNKNYSKYYIYFLGMLLCSLFFATPLTGTENTILSFTSITIFIVYLLIKITYNKINHKI
jgi:hypothetical protein